MIKISSVTLALLVACQFLGCAEDMTESEVVSGSEPLVTFSAADTEPNDSRAAPGLLSSRMGAGEVGTVSGDAFYNRTPDFFKVVFRNAGDVNFYLESPTSTDLDLYLYNSSTSTTPLAYSNKGTGIADLISKIRVAKNSTYYVEVRRYSSPSTFTGPYTLRVRSYFVFDASKEPGFYNAPSPSTETYGSGGVAQAITDTSPIWDTWGATFKKVADALGSDPYAMAAFCMFESYNNITHTLNQRQTARSGSLYAAGIASTQVQNVAGKAVPGLSGTYLSTNYDIAAEQLRTNPEWSLRFLASELNGDYSTYGDWTKGLPRAACGSYTTWGSNCVSGYGTRAQYVSRSYAFYQAFKRKDGN